MGLISLAAKSKGHQLPRFYFAVPVQAVYNDEPRMTPRTCRTALRQQQMALWRDYGFTLP